MVDDEEAEEELYVYRVRWHFALSTAGMHPFPFQFQTARHHRSDVHVHINFDSIQDGDEGVTAYQVHE